MATPRENVDFVLGKVGPEAKEAPLVELEQLNINDMNIENEVEEYQDLDEEDLSSELLYCVQEVGGVKQVEGADVYVKGPDCEGALKDIHRFIRRDNPELSMVKLELGKWQFLQNDLLPLLLAQTKDKRLSFLIIILLVDLTELSQCREKDRARLATYLLSYKHAFLSPAVIQVLLTHMADCLNKPADQRNERHDQMVELIVVLFKHLLKIPDPPSTTSSVNQLYRDLQKKLIAVYQEKNVLDSFVFLTQDFDSSLSKKLALHFLEIYYYIFRHCKAKPLIESAASDRENLRQLMEKEKRDKQRRMAEMSTRHGRFGTTIAFPRKTDGTSMLVSNIFKKDINLNVVGPQKSKPMVRKLAGKNVIEATQDKAHQIDLFEGDAKMQEILKNFANDFLDHSFSPLMEWIYHELYVNSSRVEDSDKYCFMNLCAFMVEFWRMRAIKEQQNKREQFKASNPGKPIPQIPLEYDIGYIGAVLQISTFEYVYSEMVKEIQKLKKRELKTRDYHAGVKLLTQDMLKSADPKNQRNGKILQQNVFYHDMIRIAKHGFMFFTEGLHHKIYLYDLLEYTHIMLQMLEEYSVGRVLTIQTGRMRKVKKPGKKKSQRTLEEEDNEEGLRFEEEEEEEEVEQEVVEKQFTFLNGVAELVDYTVISNYCLLLRDLDIINEPTLVPFITSYFSRIVNQLKAEWIFFQVDYLNTFYSVFQNSEVTSNARYSQLFELLKKILTKFFELSKTNHLLFVEALFKIPNRTTKEDILSNYEGVLPSDNFQEERKEEAERVEVLPKKKVIWTEEDDQTLIQNYSGLKDLENCYELLVNILKDPLKTKEKVEKRVKKLQIDKGEAKAREIMRKLHRGQTHNYNLKAEMKNVVDAFKKDKLNIEKSFEFVRRQFKAFIEYKAYCSKAGYKTVEPFAVVPLTDQEFAFMSNLHFIRMLLALELMQPVQGQCWMRIKGTYQRIDVDMVLDKFEKTMKEFWNEDRKEFCTEHVRFDPKELDIDN